MPKPYPKEFREDVVAVARRGQDTLAQIAKDFGIAESCLRNWLRAAEVADGGRPGLSVAGRSRRPTRPGPVRPSPRTRG